MSDTTTTISTTESLLAQIPAYSPKTSAQSDDDDIAKRIDGLFAAQVEMLHRVCRPECLDAELASIESQKQALRAFAEDVVRSMVQSFNDGQRTRLDTKSYTMPLLHTPTHKELIYDLGKEIFVREMRRKGYGVSVTHTAEVDRDHLRVHTRLLFTA